MVTEESRAGTNKALQEGHIFSVLQVTPELNAGGVERTTLEIAQAISRAGGLALVASAGGRLESDLEATGGELVRLPLQSKNPVTVIANAFRLKALIKKHRIDIVHARSRMPAWSALWAARWAGAAFVTTYHGIYNARSGAKRFYNSVMARGDVVIANSDYTREHILDAYDIPPERVVTIPRGVDLEVFDRSRVAEADIAAMRASWGATGDGQTIAIAPARLTRWKGQLVLVEAMRRLAQRKPGCLRLILAGDPQGRDAYVQELKSAIASAQLQETVAIVGHVRQMDVAFAAADFAVFPVVQPEAFGRGAIEAQAMGLPVIASRLGGFAETIVPGESGLLIEPNDPEALAGALERMVETPRQVRAAMGEVGRERVARLYSKSALQSATLAVYQRVLAEAKVHKP